MAKKNLKSALASHNLKKAQKAHEEKVQAAQARKADSIKASASGNAAKKRQQAIKRRKLVGVVGEDTEGSTKALELEGQIKRVDKGKKRSVEPFEKDDTILLVGEGDFSFTLSLLSPPHSHPPNRILSTSFDSEASCLAKYPLAASHLAQIRALCPAGIDDLVRFNVDAGALQSDKFVRKWAERAGGLNKVWFGFPHVGMGHKDERRNILANQLLLLRFLVSVAPLLATGEKPRYALLNEQGGGKSKKRKGGEEDEDEDEGNGDAAGEYIEEGIDGALSPLGQLDEEETLMDDDLADVPLPHEAGSDPTTTSATSATTPYPPQSAPRAGSVMVTLRESKPYTLWQLNHLATRLTSMLPLVVASAPALPKGMKAPTIEDVRQNFPEQEGSTKESPAGGNGGGLGGQKRKDRGYDVWRSFQFHPREWKGYRHVRTVGAKAGGGDLLSIKEGEEEASCRTWELGLRT
ncbi:hypothetical protein BCV69DRAFT_285393 [Microstroma glucosiphilum]|uniref:25S rRNA (uridine-N(3))-methyltransferase BMT5-like domain-containing protein n=1 Tax=Pseudomicrostroma glucosiphilum TaxID=1684307 RepID=A0A316TXR7_9BASI|nr:hypothetical protein BCV69DRAFT_285393 [Pseudomicrostroma glucosiphilum]PWN18092.1 hypothetical protein BCV69DRAFT_285393 [Pseudomicrostroma glucosiphilum]